MKLKEIIDGLQMIIDLCMCDPITGEKYEEPLNDIDKKTLDACKGAIELLSYDLKRSKLDKQSEVTYNRLIRTLYTIKRTCKSHYVCCSECMFYNKDKDDCFFFESNTLGKSPDKWDIEEFDKRTMERMNNIANNVLKEIFGFGGSDDGVQSQTEN